MASTPRPWPAGKERRFGAVSSFGFGGTNAHVVLEEAPAAPRAPAGRGARLERPLHLFSLSAKSEPVLRELARRYAGHVATHPEEPLADTCHTTGVGRAHFAHRLAIVAADSASLAQQLAAFASSGEASGVLHGKALAGQPPKVAFLFPGQGAQYAGMGVQLYDTQPAFHGALERCDEILRAHLPGAASLVALLRAASDGEAVERSPLYQTAYTQPALFALEFALAEMWRSFGVVPHAVLGHSIGEYAAACVAGAMTLEDGLALVAARGRLMQALPQDGAMALITAEEARVVEALRGREALVSIAAQNAPNQTLIAGEARAVQAVLAALEEDSILSEPLRVSHAFHSPLMDPMLDALEHEARQVSFAVPAIPMVSNLTGTIMGNGQALDAVYFRRHARAPVRFLAGMRALAEAGCRVFVEVGPHNTLSRSGKKCLAGVEATFLPSLKRGEDDWRTLLSSLAALYTRGHEVDFAGFDRGYARGRLALPTYPFERRRCWPEPHEIKSYLREQEKAHDEARN